MGVTTVRVRFFLLTKYLSFKGFNMNAINKFTNVAAHLNNVVLEKEAEIQAVLALIIAKEHGFFLGVPGTGKSYLIDSLAKCLDDARYFKALITATTTPQELYGPVSLSALRDDRLESCTKGYLPETHIAMMDEMFKGNSQTLNSMLMAMNERQFRNGSELLDIPLNSMFAASNELPADASLAALWDRFTIRIVVDRIADPKNFLRLLTEKAPTLDPQNKISLEDIEELHTAMDNVDVTPILETIVAVRQEFSTTSSLDISDRRWKQVIKYLKAHAVLRGDDKLNDRYLLLISDCLWNDPKDIPIIGSVIARHLPPNISALQRLFAECVALYDAGMKGNSENEIGAAYIALKGKNDEIDELVKVSTKVDMDFLANSKAIYDKQFRTLKAKYVALKGL
jgi:MoxR-like ATPase